MQTSIPCSVQGCNTGLQHCLTAALSLVFSLSALFKESCRPCANSPGQEAGAPHAISGKPTWSPLPQTHGSFPLVLFETMTSNYTWELLLICQDIFFVLFCAWGFVGYVTYSSAGRKEFLKRSSGDEVTDFTIKDFQQETKKQDSSWKTV